VRLAIVDIRIGPGNVCTQCNQPAVIKKFFRMSDYEWEAYACRTCRGYNEFFEFPCCARCSMPGDRLCSLCMQELEGRRSFISDTIQFAARLTAMFNYGNIRYLGGTT
jgi:hypothetical protein